MSNQIFERLKLMPPLSHWPDRPSAFRWERSAVIAHVRRVAQCDQVTAQKLFATANRKRVILFDRTRLMWAGNRNWVPREPKQPGNSAKSGLS